MKNIVFLLTLCLSVCFSKEAATNAETVWLRDVTKRLDTDKRGVTGPDLPEQLSFHLKSRTHNLVLNLNRNDQIDPNTDIYIVKTLEDGRSVLENKQISEKWDVAYYQDLENGAFMTARCVKRSSGQCDIRINGNIRLGDRNFNLRPSEVDEIQNDVLGIIGLHGRRYILQDQTNVQSRMSVENNEQTNVDEKNLQDNYLDVFQHISYGQDNINPYIKPADKTRNRNSYYVEAIVAADSSVWNLFYAIARNAQPHQRNALTVRYIREYLLHIVNGVDQMYNSIDDPSISIRVSIRAFVMWPLEKQFTHIQSTVHQTASGTTIDGDKYLKDLKHWDINVGARDLPTYDQVILFTKHMLNFGNAEAYNEGPSIHLGVCDPGQRVQIVNVEDFFATTRSTAHGLGHSLGAFHDGEDPVSHCSAKDKYIMSPMKPGFFVSKRHTPANWQFSRCSVEAFKRSLVNKMCLHTKFVFDQDMQDEMRDVLRQQPGERYDPDEQCVIKNGIGSKYTGVNPSIICAAMRCTLASNGRWDMKHVPAAPGTRCGPNKHCREAMCVDI